MRLWIMLAFGCVLGGCSLESRNANLVAGDVGLLGQAGSRMSSGVSGVRGLSPIPRGAEGRERTYVMEQGSGQFVDGQSRRQVEVDSSSRTVTLNFVDVEIQEVVRAVFDEVLKETVIIDANLKGKVTVRTPGPVTTSTARDLVRQALQASGATLVQSGGVYRVAARSDQKANKRLGDTLRLVPLKYISADEAKAALGALSSSGVEVTTGPSGQYLAIAGAAADLDNLEEVLGALDVDQMKGMSFGLFPLREAGASAVSVELNQMFNRENDPRGFKGMPIARMNAVLVISPRPHLLSAARKWIGRLDQADRDQRRIYVYPVQNRRATDIAKLLAVVLQADKSAVPEPQLQSVAPSLTPVSGGGRSRFGEMSQSAPSSVPAGSPDTSEVQPVETKVRGLRISSDISTNSIVVTASPNEWKIIEAALRRLDIMAPQVLIEATIAEVRLNDALQHGVKWYFEKAGHGFGLTGNNAGTVSSSFPGLNYSFGIPQARIVLSALEQITDVEIISSPALTVLDNQTAKLQVGDQVPIATRSSRSVISPDAPTVNDIELKDTGVILSVTPRVNASGLVVLDITQEVSDVVPTTTSNLDSPTIRQRRVNSSIAVTSGHEIILGGLIGISRSKSGSGIPSLMEMSVVGNLFKSQASYERGRTELVVILRPTVMGSNLDIQNITEEIKQRMSGARLR